MIGCSLQGGITGNGMPTQHFANGGFVNSSVPGRTDRIPTKVESDSYVIPADIISALGQGNSLAGAHIMDMILKSGKYSSENRPALAKGGSTHKPDVVIAGGEYVCPPSVIFRIGGGSMKRGHDILDSFVKKIRKHNIETQKKLPNPKR